MAAVRLAIASAGAVSLLVTGVSVTSSKARTDPQQNLPATAARDQELAFLDLQHILDMKQHGGEPASTKRPVMRSESLLQQQTMRSSNIMETEDTAMQKVRDAYGQYSLAMCEYMQKRRDTYSAWRNAVGLIGKLARAADVADENARAAARDTDHADIKGSRGLADQKCGRAHLSVLSGQMTLNEAYCACDVADSKAKKNITELAKMQSTAPEVGKIIDAFKKAVEARNRTLTEVSQADDELWKMHIDTIVAKETAKGFEQKIIIERNKAYLAKAVTDAEGDLRKHAPARAQESEDPEAPVEEAPAEEAPPLEAAPETTMEEEATSKEVPTSHQVAEAASRQRPGGDAVV